MVATVTMDRHKTITSTEYTTDIEAIQVATGKTYSIMRHVHILK